MANKDDILTLLNGIGKELATATEALEHTLGKDEFEAAKAELNLSINNLKSALNLHKGVFKGYRDLAKKDDEALKIRVKALESQNTKEEDKSDKSEEKTKDRVFKFVIDILKLVGAGAIGALSAGPA